MIGECKAWQRHQQRIKFLKLIDESTDPELDLHLNYDNYATHKHPAVRRWLKPHPLFHVHFTLTSSEGSDKIT